jgi:hypothetical protein
VRFGCGVLRVRAWGCRLSIIGVRLRRRLATRESSERKIGAFEGVPAMGLDGLGSSAYGPEAALTVLIPLGAASLAYIGWVTSRTADPSRTLASPHQAHDDVGAGKRWRLAAPALLLGSCHGKRTGVAHVVPSGLDPAVGALDVRDAELVDTAVEGIGDAAHMPADAKGS